jgi:hypothetical protein
MVGKIAEILNRVKFTYKQDLWYIIFFFLVSATTHVESWLSRQFSSIHGGLGLVPSI